MTIIEPGRPDGAGMLCEYITTASPFRCLVTVACIVVGSFDRGDAMVLFAPHRLGRNKLITVIALVALFSPSITAPTFANASCLASFYGGGRGERLARHTANGEIFDHRAMTAAHRTLKFGTLVRVSFGGRSVVVRVNDRGPARSTGRCIDLSRGAASRLGFIHAGVARVHIDQIN